MNKKILNKLVFLDTETTGIEYQDRIFQVAYKFQNKEYCELFKPEVPISIEASETTGFVNADVENKIAFANSEMKKDLEKIFSDPQNIFIAHNAKFDIKMLEKEGLKFNKVIDTLKIAQYLDPQGKLNAYRLQYLRYALDLKIENAQAHNALGDVRVLEALFNRLFLKMKESEKDEEKILAKMIEISAQPVLIKKFSFGKYLGQTVLEVSKTDRGYLE